VKAQEDWKRTPIVKASNISMQTLRMTALQIIPMPSDGFLRHFAKFCTFPATKESKKEKKKEKAPLSLPPRALSYSERGRHRVTRLGYGLSLR